MDGWKSVAVCCSVLQCVAVCCSVLQCVASFPKLSISCITPNGWMEGCCSVLQCVAVCCQFSKVVTYTIYDIQVRECVALAPVFFKDYWNYQSLLQKSPIREIFLQKKTYNFRFYSAKETYNSIHWRLPTQMCHCISDAGTCISGAYVWL